MDFNHALNRRNAFGGVVGVVVLRFGSGWPIAHGGMRSGLVAINLLPRVFAGI